METVHGLARKRCIETAVFREEWCGQSIQRSDAQRTSSVFRLRVSRWHNRDLGSATIQDLPFSRRILNETGVAYLAGHCAVRSSNPARVACAGCDEFDLRTLPPLFQELA